MTASLLVLVGAKAVDGEDSPVRGVCIKPRSCRGYSTVNRIRKPYL